MPEKLDANTSYRQLLDDILNEIERFRVKAAQELSITQMQLYFSIGKLIVHRQNTEGWGKSIVEQLSIDLKRKIGTSESFSSRNLWYMRQLFIAYQNNTEIQKLAFLVPWGQNLLVLSKLKEDNQRLFYLKRTIEAGWSRNVLLNQIKADAFGKYTSTHKSHNFGKALPANLAEQASEILKSEYTLDFLNVNEPLLERELETRLVTQIRDFILELGYGFTYIGNQYKLNLNDKQYFVDLLFFHRKLKCVVAIDLKIGSFAPEFAGKMNFYLNLLNQQVKLPDENPSIGIILCAEKDHVEVEYALHSIENPIGVSEYGYLRKLPSRLKGELPGVSELQQQIINNIKRNKTEIGMTSKDLSNSFGNLDDQS